jgi:uncharacterized protein YfdQ (DUF2303 family)
MLHYFTTIIAFAVLVSANAQKSQAPLPLEPVSNSTVETPNNWTSADFDGTFQITSDDCDISITKSFIDYIKSLRHPEQDLILDLNETRSVLIIAGSRIADPNFVPYENMVVCTAN